MAKIKRLGIFTGWLTFSLVRSVGAFIIVIAALTVGNVQGFFNSINARLFLQARLQDQNDSIVQIINQSLTHSVPRAYADAPLPCEPTPPPTTPPPPTSPTDTVPYAYDDAFVYSPGTPLYGDVSQNDTKSGNGIHTFVVTQQPTYGTVVLNPTTGIFTYTSDFRKDVGQDIFGYDIVDEDGDRDSAIVRLGVADPGGGGGFDPGIGCGCGCACAGDGGGAGGGCAGDGGGGDGDGDGCGGGCGGGCA